MSDVRTPLYERYYSTFKVNKRRKGLALWHFIRWHHEKYYPIFKSYNRDSPILEIGCGAGEMLGYFKKIGFRNVMGIDISAEQVAEAITDGYNAAHADAIAYMKEHAEQFEIILAMDIIEHFKKDELFELLSAVLRALKPGGLLVIQTPNGDGLMPGYVIYGDFTHFTILSPLSLTHILTFIGFEKIRFKEVGPGHIIHFPLFIAWQFIRLFAMIVKLIEIGRIQKYWTESIICTCRKPAVRV